VKHLFLIALVPSVALADPPRVELGVAVGGHDFSKTSELGVADDSSQPSPDSAGMIGVRAAVPLPMFDRLAIEAEMMIIPTKDDVMGDRDMVYGLRAQARFDLLTGRWRPFVVAGAGMDILRTSSPQMSNDVDPEFHWGAGVRWAIDESFDVRVDGLELFVPDRTTNGATSELELTVGMTYRFGHDPVPAMLPPPVEEEPAPPPPPVVGDRDGDGIPDNVDKCPDQPETKNGYQDEDGCPDQVIEDLAGVGFELDSAQLDPQSSPILDHAYEILSASPQLQVEISGHTSAEGEPTRNIALSLARAEVVKAYLVRKGIAATRMFTVGHGSEIPVADNTTEEGRRKNRRIEFKILAQK
jgi:outer membrane protein OmpA-like peptidoglycan-associated protein